MQLQQQQPSADKNFRFNASAESVVVFSSQKARKQFQDMIFGPFLGGIMQFFSEDVRLFKQVLTQKLGEPILVMKEDFPCAVALYSDTQSYILSEVMPNANVCQDSDAAVLCYLIRTSKNAAGEFSPLKVTLIDK